MFKIGICDDNRELCDRLDQMIWDYSRQNRIPIDIEVFYSGEELFDYLQTEGSLQLIFLDIELEQMSGIHVGDLIRNELHDHDTEIVYISGKSEYALELFNKHPLDFLIKPLNASDVIEKVKLALAKWGMGESFFYFKIGAEAHRIKCHEILFIESNGRKIKLFTMQDTFEFYGKLAEIKESLPQQFLQIHKSYIINFDKITGYGYDSVTMENSTILKVSKTYQNHYKEKLKKELRVHQNDTL